MKDSPSYYSGRFSSSNLPYAANNAVVNDDGHDEFEILSNHTPLATSSVYSKKSQSITSKRSKASQSSKWSKKSAANDKRDDYSGRVSRTSALDYREEDALVSLSASVKSSSVSSQRSKAASTISQTRSEAASIPCNLDTNSRTSTATRSKNSMLSSSRSSKSKKSVSSSVSVTKQDNVEELSALSVQQALAMLNVDGSAAKQDVPSVTASMASKRRQLKAKEIEMEERRMALDEAERRNVQREREINEKLVALRRKGEEEAAARMHSLKALELQLNEKMRVLEVKEKEYGLEINSKYNAIDAASVARRKKEKKLEADLIDFARKEHELNDRLAAIDAASVSRKKKEKKLEADMIHFAQKTLELNERLAAIDAASVARKKKEKKLEAEIVVFAQKEKEINERKAAIDAASVARKKKEKKLETEIKVFAKKEKVINDRLAAVEASIAQRQHSSLRSVDKSLQQVATEELESEGGCLGNKKIGFGSKLKTLFQRKKRYEA